MTGLNRSITGIWLLLVILIGTIFLIVAPNHYESREDVFTTRETDNCLAKYQQESNQQPIGGTETKDTFEVVRDRIKRASSQDSLPSCEEIATLNGHSNPVWSLDFSPDVLKLSF